jgi:hypothetical protein
MSGLNTAEMVAGKGDQNRPKQARYNDLNARFALILNHDKELPWNAGRFYLYA